MGFTRRSTSSPYPKMLETLLKFLAFVVIFISSTASGEPHPHTGKVAPFKAGDPGVTLNRQALGILSSGKPYQTQIQSGTAGRGLVVQDVKAPTSVVWDRILDFDRYNKMVPKTVESQTYRAENLRHHQQRIWVRMKVGFPVLKLQFFINHLYDPHKHSMTWTLDYTKKSDLDDSCGYWYVIPHPDNPSHWTRVYYSVEVSMFPWVPQFVVDFMSKQALTDATAWVKKYSELEYGKQHPEASSEGLSSPTEPRRPWWRRRKKNEKDAMQEAIEDESEKAVSTTEKVAGPRRYALVSTVLALSFYNVHLYLSQ